NERLARFPEAQTLTHVYRRKDLSSPLELKSSEASPFSEGWTARLLQRRREEASQSAGGPASPQPAVPAQHLRGFNHQSASSPPQSLVVRRGWELGGPEHYFLLTNLVPEYTLEEAVGRKNPVTLADFSTSVAEIRSALADECGGHFEVEKLSAEPTGRSNQESLTSYIGRLDEWARRCALAGAPLGDGHVIKAFREGVNDESCKEASYEYPGRWPQFRSKALTRAARADADRLAKSGGRSSTPSSSSRGAPHSSRLTPSSKILWAVQETADGAPAKQAGPTLILYPSGGQSPFTALLDSGAVRNYVSHEMAVARGWKISACSTSANLANGAVVKLRGTTEVAVSRDGRNHELTFFVLPGSGASRGVDGSTCILGVQSMCALKISLCFYEVSGSRQPGDDLASPGHLQYVALAEEDLPITVVEERENVVFRCDKGIDQLPAVGGPAQEGARVGRAGRLDVQWRQAKGLNLRLLRITPSA
ncbi:hypothetical protein FOZ61_000690, partial [Perkinsus olseni]